MQRGTTNNKRVDEFDAAALEVMIELGLHLVPHNILHSFESSYYLCFILFVLHCTIITEIRAIALWSRFHTACGVHRPYLQRDLLAALLIISKMFQLAALLILSSKMFQPYQC